MEFWVKYTELGTGKTVFVALIEDEYEGRIISEQEAKKMTFSTTFDRLNSDEKEVVYSLWDEKFGKLFKLSSRNFYWNERETQS